MSPDPRRLGFINRSDPSSGLFLILILVLLTQVLTSRPSRSLGDVVAILVAFIIATSIHEFMHAFTALKLGDDTAVHLGRLTLNPLAHFEPFGFFGMVMISLGYPFIGWGKPVPVNPGRFKLEKISRQRGMAIVALAGPISNIVQAAVVAIPLRLSGHALNFSSGLDRFLWFYVSVNLLLAAFNMIPIPPLDGSKVLLGLVPRFWYPVLAPLERYGIFVLLLLFFLGGQFGSSLVSGMYGPVYDTLARVVLGADLRL